MKEAYGGTLMIYLFLIFFVIYFSVIGVALNFAKLYRVKNNVINILEQNQFDGGENIMVHDKLKNYLSSVPYIVDSNVKMSSECNPHYTDLGICIIQKGDEATQQYYYFVRVYYYASLPVLKLTLPITASGETVVIG